MPEPVPAPAPKDPTSVHPILHSLLQPNQELRLERGSL